MPELQSIADERSDCDLVTVVVGSPQRAAVAARERNITAPVLTDNGGLRDRFKVKRTPTTFLLDRSGRAVGMLVGSHERDSINRAIDAAL